MTGENINKSLKQIGEAITNKSNEIKSDNNTIVIVICLLVSTLFWFIKALNEEYRTNVEFPIEFVNIPDDYQLYGEIPDQIDVTIEADGVDIMRYKFSYVFSSLKFDVSKYFKNKASEAIMGEISIQESALRNSIEGVLFSNSNFIGVFPENISISYSKFQEKRVPIKVTADIETEQQHIVSGRIITIPDSVTIIGNNEMLSKTEAIYTQAIRTHHLKDSLVKKVSLEEVEGLEIKERRVKLVIPVEAFTEKVLEVPVVGRHFPDSLNIRTFPGQVSVKCICGLSVYKNIHPSDFSCYIDYSQVENMSNGHTEVKVLTLTDNAKKVTLQNKTVDYLIEKIN